MNALTACQSEGVCRLRGEPVRLKVVVVRGRV